MRPATAGAAMMKEEEAIPVRPDEEKSIVAAVTAAALVPVNPEKVAELERIAKVNTLPIESVAYEADHAFFNNTRPEVYNEEAAKDAWARVIKFFRENV